MGGNNNSWLNQVQIIVQNLHTAKKGVGPFQEPRTGNLKTTAFVKVNVTKSRENVNNLHRNFSHLCYVLYRFNSKAR